MRALWVLLLVVVALVGAAVGGLWWWSRQDPAVAATHERAVVLFDAMQTYPGTTALDQAREAQRRGGVRVLVAQGSGADREIVLAVTATSDRRHGFELWPSTDETHSATRCYRWTQQRDWGTADRVTCPTHRDVDRSDGPTASPVTAATARQVERALRSGADEATVRARLTAVGAEVRGSGDAIGVAVAGVSGYDSGRRVNDCLLARRYDGRVEVWRPSSVQVAPGEATCDASAALAAGLQHPPH